MKDQKCHWLTLLPESIFGAEGEGDESGSTGDEGNASGDADGGAGNASGDSSQPHDDADDPAVKGLKSALEKERADRKKAEKLALSLQKDKDDAEKAKMDDLERTKLELEQSQTVNKALAESLLKRDLDAAIRTAAKNFIDPADAVDGIDRAAIVYEQDPNNPSIITIDTKTIDKAVKDLATKRPHYLKTGTSDGQPTGSPLGNQRQQHKGTDDALKEFYPSLK